MCQCHGPGVRSDIEISRRLRYDFNSKVRRSRWWQRWIEISTWEQFLADKLEREDWFSHWNPRSLWNSAIEGLVICLEALRGNLIVSEVPSLSFSLCNQPNFSRSWLRHTKKKSIMYLFNSVNVCILWCGLFSCRFAVLLCEIHLFFFCSGPL